MDQQAIDQNEKLLAQFLDQADPKFAADVCKMALALLTEKMTPQEFQEFLSDCIENAHEIQLYRSMNAKQSKQQPNQQQQQPGETPAPPNGGQNNGSPTAVS